MIFSLLTFTGIGFVVMLVAWLITSKKLYGLQFVTMISISDMAEVLELIKHYDEIENPAQQIARMGKMDPDEVAREIEKGNVQSVIEKMCGRVLDRMKASVPGGSEIVASHRCTFSLDSCKK